MKIYTDRNWVIVKDKKKNTKCSCEERVLYVYVYSPLQWKYYFFWLNEQSIV